MNSFFKSFGFAFSGIKYSLKERNMKVHVLCAILVVIFGITLNISNSEWCILLICIALVISMEMINTAIEHLVNLVEPNYHVIAGKVKDLAAGAVLVCAIITAIIASLIFGKYIL